MSARGCCDAVSRGAAGPWCQSSRPRSRTPRLGGAGAQPQAQARRCRICGIKAGSSLALGGLGAAHRRALRRSTCCLRQLDFLQTWSSPVSTALIAKRGGALGCEEIRSLMTIPGVDITTAATLVAVIGDVDRFPTARHLVGYLGPHPRSRQSGSGPARSPRNLASQRLVPKHRRLRQIPLDHQPAGNHRSAPRAVSAPADAPRAPSPRPPADSPPAGAARQRSPPAARRRRATQREMLDRGHVEPAQLDSPLSIQRPSCPSTFSIPRTCPVCSRAPTAGRDTPRRTGQGAPASCEYPTSHRLPVEAPGSDNRRSGQSGRGTMPTASGPRSSRNPKLQGFSPADKLDVGIVAVSA